MHVGVMVGTYHDADWERVMAGDYSRPPSPADHELVAEMLRYGHLVEPLGFDSIWAAEHWGSPYSMGASPLQQLTYWAAKTERIDVGSGVLVLPWWNPFRLAHEISMLDVLLNGRRFHIGVGRGTSKHEYASLGVDYETSRDRFNDTIDILRLGDTREQFDFRGPVYDLPDSSIRPQARHKGELYRDVRISGVSTASLENGARKGMGLIFVAAEPLNVMPRSVAHFNQVRMESGFEPDQPTIMLFMYCAPTKAEAEEGYRYLARHTQVQSYQYVQWKNPSYQRSQNVQPSRLIDTQSTNQLIGTPDEILRRLATLQELTSFNRLVLHGKFSGVPLSRATDSLTLFAREVLPALHEWDTPLHPVSTDEALAAEAAGAISASIVSHDRHGSIR
jgi:alkanesulfonate monooxygenase SsuD/methylene tetrahydromethanopterin reductase-like flavin-dependent oxidoreductase (luciferase family)